MNSRRWQTPGKALDSETQVVMEYTGLHHELAIRFLHDKVIFVSVFNPKLIKYYGPPVQDKN